MSDGHRSGRSAGSVVQKHRVEVIIIIIIIFYLTPVLSSQGMKNSCYAIQKSAKTKLQWTCCSSLLLLLLWLQKYWLQWQCYANAPEALYIV